MASILSRPQRVNHPCPKFNASLDSLYMYGRGQRITTHRWAKQYHNDIPALL